MKHSLGPASHEIGACQNEPKEKVDSDEHEGKEDVVDAVSYVLSLCTAKLACLCPGGVPEPRLRSPDADEPFKHEALVVASIEEVVELCHLAFGLQPFERRYIVEEDAHK